MDNLKEFTQAVHQAYAHLHDRVLLQEDPLRQLLGRRAILSVENLHRTLIDALEWLRPLGTVTPAQPEWRRYRHLQLRYVEGASADQIIHELQVSPRQARRDHAEALDEVARLLWSRLVQAPPATLDDSGLGRGGKIGNSSPAMGHGELDAELSSLVATTASSSIALDEIIVGVVETVGRLAAIHRVDLKILPSSVGYEIAVNRTALRQLLLSVLTAAIEVRRAKTVAIGTMAQPGQIVDVVVTARRSTLGAAGQSSPDSGETVSLETRAIIERLSRVLEATPTCEESVDQVVFRLRLPASPARSILLVDDNPDVALLFRRYLEGTTYRLLQARSAERALRLANAHRPAVIILDVLLPTHDGWEILHALRAEPTTAAIPVVICSVLPDHALAYSLGVADFLTKPVRRAELLAVLGRLLATPLAEGNPSPNAASDKAR